MTDLLDQMTITATPDDETVTADLKLIDVSNSSYLVEVNGEKQWLRDSDVEVAATTDPEVVCFTMPKKLAAERGIV